VSPISSQKVKNIRIFMAASALVTASAERCYWSSQPNRTGLVSLRTQVCSAMLHQLWL
jgi:hypothetical protein